MSIKGIIDTCVHVQSFRNIDLFEQGVYILAFTLEQDGCFYSSPHYLERCSDRSHAVRRHKVLDASLEDIHFFSRGFLIKYADEEVLLNDIAIFRSEIDRESEDRSLRISVHLMYAEHTDSALSLSDFTIVSTQQMRIEKPLEGVNQFLPVHFTGHYPCQVNLCVHVIQIDFRYRFKGPEEGAYDVHKLTAQTMFQTEKTLSDKEIDMAYAQWVRHLYTIYEKNYKLLGNFRALLEQKNSESIAIPTERFSQRYEARDCLAVTSRLIKEIQTISEHLHRIEHEILQVIKEFPDQMAKFMQMDYLQKLKDHWGGCTFKDTHQVSSLAQSVGSSSATNHSKIADILRNTPLFANANNFEVYQVDFFPESFFHPILFHDVFHLPSVASQFQWSPEFFSYMPRPRKNGLHLIVFVHGFQGSSFDVRMMKNCISTILPDCTLLCSMMNEGETEGDIAEMGERLAEEVRQYVMDWCPPNLLTKISFVGHSLGGVIIRAALPKLLEYGSMFHMLITFSTPHLGYMYNASSVVGAGLWILKKWRKSLCLQQLSLTDAYDLRDCFLYKLSSQRGIEFFKHIALIGSYQDSYAPYESARIEVNSKITSNTTRSAVHVEMVNNVISQVQTGVINRLDISYKTKGQSLDHWIGRSAHIEMLDNNSMIQMILFSCAHFFE